ncbi:MAG: type ISP restriction/modification enzyme [Microcoleaceae cyanobacterium]
MSKILINQFYTNLDNLIQYGGSRKETAIRTAFQTLLNEYCKTKNFLLVPELEYRTTSGKTVNPDGTVKDAIRLDYGYWESKDEYDNLDKEIEKKLAKGYPNDNILFEDSQTAVLIQKGQEVMRVPLRDEQKLDAILNTFLNYTRPEVKDFREAIEAFQADLPTILDTLRKMIDAQSINNPKFQQARDKFWQVCQDSIHPDITLEDIREMMIQHILTEDIFISIFNDSQFHRENNIARQLQEVIETFFTGATKRNTLSTIERYYAVIRRTAANIYNHHEKQKFLKAVYENFYQAYNPKAADRLGIVYTPNEIVRFMIESVDYLLHQHFGKILADQDVEILDPATGTGTFITELIEYLPKNKLTYKYLNEIHCNEVAILPYYIANLNIEFTYQQKMGKYEEFANICLVDTLDHTGFEGKQLDLFAMTVENTARIKRQNDRAISVIIGNPPYNANQQNENENNKNREYPAIDQRIKATYIKESTAQKTKLYDMYSRFFRWASDRLGENGILAFVTNSSFIEARTFDGFRKVVSQDFSHIYIIDLGGDVRKNPKISGTKHNVFGIQTGVAISFMVKKQSNQKNVPCQIFYTRRDEFDTAEDKLKFLASISFAKVDFSPVTPDAQSNWINLTDNNFDSLLPLVEKNTKLAKNPEYEKALFKFFSTGISTNRDQWIIDFNQERLSNKMMFFVSIYHNFNNFKKQIKWSRNLKERYHKGLKEEFKESQIIPFCYRPFCPSFIYDSIVFIDERGYAKQLGKEKLAIAISGKSHSKHFQCFTSNLLVSLDTLEKTQCLPLYRDTEAGEKIDNITDWGLQQFQTHYQDKTINKLDIFHYVYAVLHHPDYRQKYAENLKRDFPRIPFYEDFSQWVKWGKKLMDLHINYQTVKPYKLTRVDLPIKSPQKTPKTLLKADKTEGSIILDDVTTLEGIPKTAWEYKLGNRCALEWVLDQYKEKKPKDPTIAERFNTYKFADYKEKVIELLARVCTVSVETMTIIDSME